MSTAGAAARPEGLAVHVPRDRRRALAEGRTLPEDASGTVLFADVSGFTPLTELLARRLGPRRGAERLTVVLDGVLGVLIDEVHRVDGSVVYFSGDAITVWIDGDDGTRGVACADRMQRAMATVALVEVDGESTVLGLKVAVAAGPARRFVVGDPDIQLVDVLAGRLLDEVAAAEAVAAPGDVVVTADVLGRLDPARSAGAVVHAQPPVAVLPPGSPRSGGSPTAPVGPTGATPSTAPPLPDEHAAAWVQRAVRGRLVAGDGGLLAELRHVTTVFVDLGAIDFETADAPELLDGLLGGIQRIVARHGGAQLTLTVGDKGAYTYAVFGTPFAHEDDAARAVAAGLAVQELSHDLGVAGVRVGVAGGRVFSGVQGHPDRRTFVCLGDPVNLAARTMAAAGPGEVLVGPTVAAAIGDAAVLRPRPPTRLKGRSAPIMLSAVAALGAGSTRGAGLDATPFLGQDAALEQLVAVLTRGPDRGAAAAVVLGVAGAGKSRLVREAAARLDAAGRRVLVTEAQGYGGTVPYEPWRAIWRTLLRLPDGPDAGDALVERLGEVDDRFVPRAPLLAPVVGLDLPPTPLTASMEPRVAKDSREDLLVALLAALDEPPLVLVLDDAHAADRLSIDLASAIARAGPRLDDAVLLVGRPAADGASALADVPGVEQLVRLPALDADAVSRLLDHHAAARLGGADALHPTVRAAVVERAQGNPLTVAELVRALAEQGVDPTDPAAAAVELPTSLEALVLGRVDRLPDSTRGIIKVGSVMLRGFGAETLAEVYPDLGSETEIAPALAEIPADLLARRDGSEYEIRHALTREVAYSSLPFGLRRRLHRAVASRVERLHGGATGPHVDELAHHSWFGEADGREHWTRLAAARATESYANDAALTYLDRLVEVTAGATLVDALLDRAEVLTLVGRLDEARGSQRTALEVAEELDDDVRRGRSLAGLAETARRASELDRATTLLAAAEEAFALADDEAGRARVLHLTGTVAAMRGDLDAAGTAYRTALAIRDRLGDDPGRASLMSNLGIVAEYDGNLEAAAARHAEALRLRERIGDRWAIANSRTNLGMIALLSDDPATARAHFEAALRGNEDVGDPWHVALGRHNLGNALRDLGQHQEAARLYEEAARHFVSVGDDWAVALLLEDAATLQVSAGEEVRAAELLGGADAIRERLDAPRAASLEESVAVTLAAAAASVGRATVEEAVRRGRERDHPATLAALARTAGRVGA